MHYNKSIYLKTWLLIAGVLISMGFASCNDEPSEKETIDYKKEILGSWYTHGYGGWDYIFDSFVKATDTEITFDENSIVKVKYKVEWSYEDEYYWDEYNCFYQIKDDILNIYPIDKNPENTQDATPISRLTIKIEKNKKLTLVKMKGKGWPVIFEEFPGTVIYYRLK